MLPSHAHACGYIYLRACGCRDCNTGLPGLLSSQSSSPVLPSSTIAEGTCFLGKKKKHVPWDKHIQGHTAERDMVQQLQPGSSRPDTWSSMEEAGRGDALAVHGWLEGT